MFNYTCLAYIHSTYAVIFMMEIHVGLYVRRRCFMYDFDALRPFHNWPPTALKHFCGRKFSHSYVLSLPLHDASHLFYAIKWSHQVASHFWTCSKFRGNTWLFKLLHWVSRTFAQRCTTLGWLARVLHEFLAKGRKMIRAIVCVCCMTMSQSLVRHVAYDLAMLYYRCTSLAH